MRSSPILLVAVCACSSSAPSPPGPTDPADLTSTLADLAALGAKHVGTPEGSSAGDYVSQRFLAAGLTGVHFESFQVPRFDLQSSGLSVSVDGAALSPQPGFDVFEASGNGHVDADVVFAGDGTPGEVAAANPTGKIVLIRRNAFYHRSTQYKNIAAAGGVAMLYVSAAADNLRQVGSVKFTFEAQGAIPAITIGSVDGESLITQVTGGHTVHAVIDVQATTTPAMGRNVVGRIEGERPEQIVIGAHYDTWFIGSTDNGGGVAALLALAAKKVREAKIKKPAYTLVFVGYDGEEVALYGGYDYLRKHRVLTQDPIVTVLNFEVPSAVNSDVLGLGRSNVDALDKALVQAAIRSLYGTYVPMDLVPSFFGGIIPTDIQGIYRSGVPTASTADDSPYYHTTEDTPDKVDAPFLASVVDAFDLAIDNLGADDPSAFAMTDAQLWKATVAPRARSAGQDLVVDATVTDASGAPQANAPAAASLLHDDFFLAGTAQTGTTDANGKISFTFPAADAEAGAGPRFVHVTSGPMWPLVEEVVSIP
jgi:Zn-dependent M28 family amino/carboxypeptidase